MLQIEICHILHFTMAGSTIICPWQKVAVKLVLSEDLDKFCLAQSETQDLAALPWMVTTSQVQECDAR